ncbi:MAG TPA: cytochrome c3 family protein [Coriobacteriia bacterium]
MVDAGEAERHDPGEAPSRRRTMLAWLALASVVATVVALLVLDLWIVRPPAQREFIARNMECLRCHPDLIPRLSQASVHQPFAEKHCTSCHTRHGYERTARFRPAEAGPEWLRVRLEQLGLRVIWDLLTAMGSAPRTPPATASPVTGGPSLLTSPEERLCWTCHGDIGFERLETFQHPPFADGHCTSCHDPHASDTSPLLRADAADLCAACHRIGPELLAEDVHLPFGQRRCLVCHEPHASSHGRLLTAAQRDLCFGCHPGTAAALGEAVLHRPFVSGQCTGCHRPHSADFARLLAAPQPELCYACHGGVSAQFTLASRHPVPSRLICSDCHLPHAAPVRGLLPVAQRQLCLGCHANVRAQLTRPVVHAPVARDDCTRCHTPHGSATGPLLQAADPVLCTRCHPAIPARPVRSPAPFRRDKRPRRIAKRAVPAGMRATGLPDPIVEPGPAFAMAPGDTSHRVRRCAECHEAHASSYVHLAVALGNSLCLRCHATDVSRFGRSAHRDLPCSRCHRPHLARAAPLLNAGNPRLCVGCHTHYADSPRYHPVGAAYYDYVARGPLTCTSTCHDPHGSGYKRMLRVPYENASAGSDGICTLCHTAVEVDY